MGRRRLLLLSLAIVAVAVTVVALSPDAAADDLRTILFRLREDFSAALSWLQFTWVRASRSESAQGLSTAVAQLGSWLMHAAHAANRTFFDFFHRAAK